MIVCVNITDNITETPVYHENLDLENIKTPVKVEQLVRFLKETKFKQSEIDFLENGFTNGFNIGYEGPTEQQSLSSNIPLTVGSKVELWNKIMKEVKLKRVAGPFSKPPFENFIQSPVGLVPKVGSENQTRLIFHLSYKFENSDAKGSLNEHTPKEKCKVKYKDLDYAVRAYLKLVGKKKSNRTVYAGKTDIKSAFRLLPLSKSSWRWLIIKVQDPTTGEWKFFVDKCLPFGASISCALFQRFSDALCHIAECKTQSSGLEILTNYLDDFLFIALAMIDCNEKLSIFLDICKKIGVPIAEEKTEWATVTALIIFLGILLDGKSLTLSIPLEKRNRAVKMLQFIKDKKKATVKELQVLCGYLNFLCKAIFPGRPFVRRMYAKYSTKIPGLKYVGSSKGQ